MNAPSSNFRTHRPAPESVLLREPLAPAWAMQWAGGNVAPTRLSQDGISLTMTHGDEALLISAVVPNASQLGVDDFQACVRSVYLQIYQLINASRYAQPWRFWNFVPGILNQETDGLLRYMVFNAGRHQAMLTRHGAREFASAMVAASAVEAPQDDLVVHLLAGVEPGRPVENPRQIPAFHYSPRYGPLPPCFARATQVTCQGRSHLLISGTASIVGEDTTHLQQIEAQCHEVIANFTSLIQEAAQSSSASRPSANEPEADILAALRDLRIYLPDMAHRGLVESILLAHCSGLEHIEVLPARLCRPELEVEIEARATLSV